MYSFAKKHFTLLGIVCSLSLILISVPLQQNIEAIKGKFDIIRKSLYLSSSTLNKISLGYNLLVADIYWIRALQYFSATDYYDEKPMETYRYFDIITDLDPQFVNAYRYGGTFLAEPPEMGLGEIELGVKLLEKGRINNPENFRIALDEAFIYYIYTDNYIKASELFEIASEVDTLSEKRSASIKGMAALALTKSGNLELSKKIWTYIYKTSTLEDRKQYALTNLNEVKTMEHQELLTQSLQDYKSRYNEIPEDLTVLVEKGYLRKIPDDPSGGRFVIINDTITVVSSKLAEKKYSYAVKLLNTRINKYRNLYGKYPSDLSELKEFVNQSPINKYPENPYGREFEYNPETGEIK